MSIESYAIHIAKPGSKADLAAKEITDARDAAVRVRTEFNKAHAAEGALSSDFSVTGLVFKNTKPYPLHDELPEGWRLKDHHSDGDKHFVIAVPNRKTPKGRELAIALSSLPSLPGADEFTKRIGSDFIIVGRFMLKCWFHRMGNVLFVMTPWKARGADHYSETTPTDNNREAFHPEDCDRVPVSAYYLAKENAATIAPAGATT